MLTDSINEKYEGYAGMTITSIGWNFMMYKVMYLDGYTSLACS